MKWWSKFISWLDLNNDKVVTGADFDLAKEIADQRLKDANQALNQTYEEAKRRTKRVKKEVKDVVASIKEVGNQIEDIGEAATTSKKRPGRKKKNI